MVILGITQQLQKRFLKTEANYFLNILFIIIRIPLKIKNTANAQINKPTIKRGI